MISRLLCAALATTLLLSGCGFRLQGNYQYPEQLAQVQLQSNDQYGELHRLLQDKMRLHNIQVVNDANAPRIWLNNDQLERTTLSLFPSGQVAEYQLVYSVSFNVQLQQQQAQTFNVEVRRDYLDDPRTALAKNRELDLLLQEMRQSAADKIMRILATTEVDQASQVNPTPDAS
ncbi:LPS assembly lipoprotein LptE [uncultured Ferrimonas sp.]|uniref:LPS-assembly lipoprotein LptE n=1 Tax=uncultured Ferrimonas sp. TaxID=432640 RepID=UPI0026243190|nr:LPS assembly lipoprotein LptE [uncultured Ferrimonas sp.]